jgi:hypothetical protein
VEAICLGVAVDGEDRVNIRSIDGAQQQALGLDGRERSAQLIRRYHVSHATETGLPSAVGHRLEHRGDRCPITRIPVP